MQTPKRQISADLAALLKRSLHYMDQWGQYWAGHLSCDSTRPDRPLELHGKVSAKWALHLLCYCRSCYNCYPRIDPEPCTVAL